jgi:hypothetical protein
MVIEPTAVTGPTMVIEPTAVVEPTAVIEPTAVVEPTAMVIEPTRSAEVVVATSPVPVVAPTRIPEIAGTPLRERAWLSLSLRRDTQTGESQTGGHYGCCCGKAYGILHASLLPEQAMENIRDPKPCVLAMATADLRLERPLCLLPMN